MSSPDVIYDKLTQILQNVFDDDTLVARADLVAADVAGWDSFAHLRLIMTVERAFKVRFTAMQISSLKNVGELAALIETRLAK
jgi:acyl carrier protein